MGEYEHDMQSATKQLCTSIRYAKRHQKLSIAWSCMLRVVWLRYSVNRWHCIECVQSIVLLGNKTQMAWKMQVIIALQLMHFPWNTLCCILYYYMNWMCESPMKTPSQLTNHKHVHKHSNLWKKKNTFYWIWIFYWKFNK